MRICSLTRRFRSIASSIDSLAPCTPTRGAARPRLGRLVSPYDDRRRARPRSGPRRVVARQSAACSRRASLCQDGVKPFGRPGRDDRRLAVQSRRGGAHRASRPDASRLRVLTGAGPRCHRGPALPGVSGRTASRSRRPPRPRRNRPSRRSNRIPSCPPRPTRRRCTTGIHRPPRSRHTRPTRRPGRPRMILAAGLLGGDRLRDVIRLRGAAAGDPAAAIATPPPRPSPTRRSCTRKWQAVPQQPQARRRRLGFRGGGEADARHDGQRQAPRPG